MYMGGPFTGLVKNTNTVVRRGSSFDSGGDGGGGGISGSGLSDHLIGPFPATQGCPAGSVVAHRFGAGLDAQVQCRMIKQSEAPAPTQINPVFNISNDPVFDTDINPIISPNQSNVSSPNINSPGATTDSNPTMNMPIDQGMNPGTNANTPPVDYPALLQQQNEANQRAREREDQLRQRAEAERRELENALRESQSAAQRNQYESLIEQQQRQFQQQLDVLALQRQQEQERIAAINDVPSPVITPGITVPGSAMIPGAPIPDPAPQKEPIPIAWLLGGGSALLLGAIFLTNQPKGKKK
jgi:hypothetical protein